MAEITEEQVRHVAMLSRLEVTPAEVASYAADLTKIVSYVEKLNELDTSGVAPTSHSLKLQNVFRADVERPSLNNAEALATAPEAEEHCFKVPAVLQGTGGG